VRALGELQLTDTARSRLDLRAQKTNEGQLTADEAHEYDRFIELGDIIATLRLKAERQQQFRTRDEVSEALSRLRIRSHGSYDPKMLGNWFDSLAKIVFFLDG
jgi:hypothetical protein